MKIAVVLNDFSGTGVPRVTLRMVEGLILRGHEVDLIVLNPHGPMRKQVATKARIVELNVSRAISSVFKLIRYIRRQQPDAIIAAEDQLGIIVAFSCLVTRSKSRLLVTSHVPYSKTNLSKGLKGRVFLSALKILWWRIDTFTTVSAGLADDMARETGIPREEIKVLHNAVISEKDIERKPDKYLHPFFESGDKVVLAMGSLHKRKGFHDLIEAVRLVNIEIPVRLIILGEGRERPRLEQQIRDADLSDQVDLYGYSDDPFKYLQTADLFVLPSYFEGLPTVLIEALSCGCPIVSYDCISGPREILLDGEHGELVEVGNIRELTEKIKKKLINSGDSEELMKRALDFTAATISERVEVLIGR